ncbi:MAG: hypothetical protein CME71_05405 [Halobacteriovorax sp.]|nr:hypothetical protein [Halobacteriovorax sp.]
MKRLSTISIAVIASLFLGQAFCATKSISVPELKKTVHQVQKQVDQLAHQITKLEKDLGKKHGEYLDTIKVRQNLEAKLSQAENSLKTGQNETNDRIEKLRTILKRLALQELDHNQNAAALAAKSLLSKQVNIQLKTLNAVAKNAQTREDELKELRARIDEYYVTESRLAELVQTMESKKKESADAYLLAMSKKSEAEEKLSALKLTKRVTKQVQPDIAARFSSPVDDFLGLEYDKKGITYKFNGRRPVLAADTGTVAYAGRLSTYGNVVLIDHGDETRSVVLGQFLPKMTKGQTVNRGDVIGYTDNTVAQGKVYFEVRKGDKVLDTIALMDKDFLKKHRVTKI